MKRIIFLISIFVMVFPGCDVLNVDPNHSIPADQAITNAEEVERGIIGCYDAMQSGSYYGLHYFVFGDLLADNLRFSGVTISYAELDNNSILADNGLVEGVWASIYDLLNRVNNVVAQIPGIESMSDAEKNAALAELYFLRALGHYDLMRLYGPIPLRTEPASGDEESLNKPRESIEVVLSQINTDLDFAISHLASEIITGRASSVAARGLKARVALHQYYLTSDQTFLTTAKENASAVIDNPNLEIEPDYSILFSGVANRESIFEIDFNEQDWNRMAQYFFYTSLSGRYEFAPTEFYLNSFAPDDVRKDISIEYYGANPYVYKYSDIETGTDNIYVLRLAEMHLIRAEAEILLQGDLEAIRADINAIRERAGLIPTTSSNYAALLLEVESQRQKEFAFEGHRWFDLVRTGRALDVLPNVTNINQTLFPIPLNEILANDNPGMFQNEGY
ncbi:MAG: RagB/SusD family nutrient uptake outer membrane protein [Bacteroides sp.]|nr:RagB/SusD family nutrient uptake outer membrane protein [Bacteroides sp.]